MIIPPASAIESALNTLANADPVTVMRELKELHVAGGVKVIGLPFPADTPNFAKGYLLGLETVRYMFRAGTFQSGVTL